MTALFISDLHLDDTAPSAVDSFVRVVGAAAGSVERLYILGDLFEAWIGDDDTGEPGRAVATALHAAHLAGTTIGLQHGNRDFLLGTDFCRRAGAELLPDPHVIDLYGCAVLITHGDRLCTDDTDYLAFREQVRSEQWQRHFMAQDLASRRDYAAQARTASRASQAGKDPHILDANQNAIEAEMRAAGVRFMIHGHTHRPAIHRFEVEGDAYTRVVLGDWGTTAMALRWDSLGYKLFDVIGNPL
jgi:UDP-2,3-diacylglucosamine hydrolase